MTTRIYPSYSAFLSREDKSENGVSEAFSARHADWEAQNATNSGCYDCYGCSDCSDCSRCYGCSDCSRCSRCYDCSGCSRCYDCYDCYGCSDCSDCYGCSRCSDCSGCSDCSDCSGEKGDSAGFTVPIITNIHQAVLAAASNPGALNMCDWHTCDTTHCRAGWVERLAGEAGRKLAEQTSTLFAAMQIYHKSSPGIPVLPTRFFEPDNAIAMQDMARCAALEEALPAA